jgi:RNA polymerase sigma-70 factor (ECF subfamily)
MASYCDDFREPCGLAYGQLAKLPDDIVMAHLGAGHGDAVAVLLDRYSRLVLRVAFKIVRNQSEAEDITQDVFVDLCRTAGQFDAAKGTTKMWIVRTAYRRSLTRRRNLKMRGWQNQGDFEELINISSGAEHILASKLSSYESQRLVRQILGKLDAPQRRVLELVFFDGLTMREVAAKMGASHESVRHRYYRGIDKLRQLMTQVGKSESVSQRREQVDVEA